MRSISDISENDAFREGDLLGGVWRGEMSK